MNISKEYFLFLVNMKYSDHVVLLTVFSIGFAYFILKLARRRVRSSTSLRGDIPSGRLGLPYIGETLSFMLAVYSTKGCYDFVRVRRIRFGKWFKTRLFGKVHVFVPSVEGAKIIYTNDFVKFNKGYMKSMADCMGKKSVFCVPHQDHTRIRHILSDFFSMDSLCSFVEKFDQMLCQRLEKLERSGKSFLLIDFSNELTFDALCCLLMSVTEESLLRKLQNYVTAISEGMLSFPVMIPGTKYYKGIKARRCLMETFQDMIDRRRNGKVSPEPQDFLESMLRRDSYPQSEKLDDSEIMDGLLSLIIAGQSTTAAVMLWSVKYLDDNRKVQDKLRVEQLSIARSKPKEASLSFEDINNMSYCWKVVKETMRMANVVMWYPRVALSDSTIEGFEIKKGWNANIDATCIHYDPNLYPEPTKFNPSRFDDIQKPYSFIPFGAGPRTCLGINMGKMTMIVFLHRLTSGYRWTVDDPDNSLERKAHIPKLRNGCPITLMAL